MRRRAVLLGLGAIGAGRVARAQMVKPPTTGTLFGGSAPRFNLRPFLAGLAELGYREGENVIIESRFAEGRYETLPSLAAGLISRRVDVIGAFASQATLAAKAATATIPIVFAMAADPVALGLVTNLNRPAGNITGATFLSIELQGKQIELLHELAPNARNIGFLINPDAPDAAAQIGRARAAADALGLTLRVVETRGDDDFAPAFAALAERRAEALLVGGDEFFTSRSEQIASLAAYHALPAIANIRIFPAFGLLASYGGSLAEANRQAGVYAGRILQGARPADLPVQQTTRFELVINLKTAKALGLAVPQSILSLADEVIE